MRKWDERFLDMSDLVASWSKDPSTKVGAVIARPDKTICSVGYNGFPRGMNDSDEIYADRETKYARVIHAEMNALLAAPEDVAEYTMYTSFRHYGPSCDRCSAHVIQSGIERVVCRLEPEDPSMERWQDSITAGLKMYKEAGVQVDLLEVPLRKATFHLESGATSKTGILWGGTVFEK
jgi:dCMP deaminase